MNKRNSNGCFPFFILVLALVFFLLIGEIKCIIKFMRCDFKPSYKAEVIYGLGTFTGLGSIIGWVNIKDNNIIKESN